MEKFILLFRGSDVYQPGQSPEALEELTAKMMNWLVELSEKGLHVTSEKLQQSGQQVNGRNKIIVDIPFGATKDIIGGWTIVLAENFNAAVEIAKACPILASDANIEIRPLLSF